VIAKTSTTNKRKLQENLKRVKDKIARACDKAKRDPAEVRMRILPGR